MKNRILRFAIILLVSCIITTGCNVTDDKDKDKKQLEGLYVLNQGRFQDGVASITVYDPKTDSVQQEAYQDRNGRPLGNVGQSLTQIGDLLYAVINNSQRVVAMDAQNLQHAATINFADSLSPRYMIEARENIAYVTNWAGFTSPGYVSVVNLTTNEVMKHIKVGLAPEQLAQVGNRVYVANSGLGNGQTIAVLNSQEDRVVGTIQVSDNPVNVKADNSGRIWVLCQGAMNSFTDPDDDTPGRLYVLNGSNGTKIDSTTISLDLGSAPHPRGFSLNENRGLVYLLKGGIHTLSMSSLEVKTTPFIRGSFFAVEYYSNNQRKRIYTTDAKGFQKAGQAYIYDLSGSIVDSFRTAIGPGDFHFSVN